MSRTDILDDPNEPDLPYRYIVFDKSDNEEDTPSWYVIQSPNIHLSSDRADALEMTKREALFCLNSIMMMQSSSSSRVSNTREYTVKLVK